MPSSAPFPVYGHRHCRTPGFLSAKRTEFFDGRGSCRLASARAQFCVISGAPDGCLQVSGDFTALCHGSRTEMPDGHPEGWGLFWVESGPIFDPETLMPALKLSTDIRPVSDLKSHGAEIVRQVNDTSRPVVLTRHGRSVAVVLSIEEYEANVELRAWADLRRAILKGERSLEEHGPVPHSEVVDYLRSVANGK